MNKLTRKLFRYFAVLEMFLIIIVFLGFSLVFHHYTTDLHEKQLKERVETISARLEEFADSTNRQSGRGAYLKFLDDISMADTYIVSSEGKPFSFGNNHIIVNEPTEEIQKIAEEVFQADSFLKKHEKSEAGKRIIYVGMPVKQGENIIASVVIRDEDTFDREGFLQAVAILGVCLGLSLILSLAFSYYLSLRFMKPIQKIALTTRELAAGNYAVKTEIQDQTELGELAKETDLLAVQLENARLESQRLEQMQKDYFADISHELRTPVTVIRSSLEAICDGVVDNEKAEEYQRQMLAESISLQRLVNDMLELSRLQNYDFPIQKEAMNILLALDDAIRAVRVIAGEKQIQILYEKKEYVWMIEGDYGRIRQMFIAVLDNAIKFSKEGQSVMITAEKQENLMGKIIVKDSGCGIRREDLQNIFYKFYRASSNTEKGSGLGLAIIKSIGDRHSISVDIDSAPGEGTTVCFTIPLQDS